MTETYDLCWKDTHLGVLEVDGQGRHRYRVDRDAAERLRKTAPIGPCLLEDSPGDFGPPMPFFKARLETMTAWKLTELNYQTDWFLLKKRL